MCSVRPFSERLWPLSVFLFLPLAACGLGVEDSSGQGAAFINGRPGVDAGTQPAPDGGGGPQDPSCDAGHGPLDECSALGGICLPGVDPAGQYGCPPGLAPLPVDCGDPNGLAVCCVRLDEPPPPVDCYSQGGYCSPVDPNQGGGCLDGAPGYFDPSCGDPMNGGGLCCLPSEPPPPPPPDDCGQYGGICLPFDPNDPTGQWLGCPDGLTELPAGCADDGSGVFAICCGRPDEPPPGDCAGAGGFCGGFDPAQGLACPPGTQGAFDASCGDPMNGGGVCCWPDQPPPPPDDCGQYGGICLPGFDPGDPNGQWLGCPDGLLELPASCGDDGSGSRAICCGRGDGPPPGLCPDPSAPNVFYVSEDPALCAAISYACPSNHVVFDSDCGCGCIGY